MKIESLKSESLAESEAALADASPADAVGAPDSRDWRSWMQEFGQRTRRIRDFLGMSQEQVARLAGVSQGAVSRLEAGRGLATPLLVALKIQQALTRGLHAVGPEVLTPEMRRVIEVSGLLAAPLGGAEQVTTDSRVERWVRLYQDVPAAHRDRLLAIATAAVEGLKTPDR